MGAALREYTPAEAAAVSEVGLKSVHNAIDKRIIESGLTSRHGRALTDDDLLRLKLWYGVGSILTAERRKRLFQAIKDNPTAPTVRADDYLIVDVARAREQLSARADALRQAETIIHSVKGVVGGEPIFKGTRVPVRMIASIKEQGATTVEILEGYPSITSHMVELAEIWTAAHPARGRPKKLSDQGLTAKSTTRLSLKEDPRPRSSGASS